MLIEDRMQELLTEGIKTLKKLMLINDELNVLKQQRKAGYKYTKDAESPDNVVDFRTKE